MVWGLGGFFFEDKVQLSSAGKEKLFSLHPTNNNNDDDDNLLSIHGLVYTFVLQILSYH